MATATWHGIYATSDVQSIVCVGVCVCIWCGSWHLCHFVVALRKNVHGDWILIRVLTLVLIWLEPSTQQKTWKLPLHSSPPRKPLFLPADPPAAAVVPPWHPPMLLLHRQPVGRSCCKMLVYPPILIHFPPTSVPGVSQKQPGLQETGNPRVTSSG